jgi:hypothetical protein
VSDEEFATKHGADEVERRLTWSSWPDALC